MLSDTTLTSTFIVACRASPESEFGIPAETLSARYVNGFFYSRLRPLVSPDKPPRKAPPRVVLQLVARVHPEFRRRTKAAARTLEDRPWRAEVERWPVSTGQAGTLLLMIELMKLRVCQAVSGLPVTFLPPPAELARALWRYRFIASRSSGVNAG